MNNNKDIINKEIKVLDHGFVKLVDMMGDDNRVVQAARVSYNGESKGEEKDAKLIAYLIENMHTSPLEHCIITLHIKAPLFVVAQWVRHRTWSFNFISYRYTEPKMDYYYPDEWRAQSKSNKQMSSGETVEEKDLYPDFWYGMYGIGYIALHSLIIDWYNKNVENGMAREVARMILAQSLYTEFYATVDLNNLLKFIALRDHSHAQYEIQVYAKAIEEMVKEWVPHTWEAFEEHVLGAVKFSKSQKALLVKMLSNPNYSTKPEEMKDYDKILKKLGLTYNLEAEAQAQAEAEAQAQAEAEAQAQAEAECYGDFYM